VEVGRTLKLLDVATLAVTRSFEGVESLVPALAYSPDGKVLAVPQVVPERDAQVVLCEAASGRRIRVLPHHSSVLSIAFAPGGTTLAAGLLDGNLLLWDPSTGTQKALVAQKGLVTGLAFAPDGRTLATAGRLDGVKLWDVPGPLLVEQGTLTGAEGSVHIILYSPDGKTLATAGVDRKLRLWDAANTRRAPRVLSAEEALFSAAFAPDGKTLVSAGTANLTVWDLATGKPHAIEEAQRRALRGIAFSPDGKTLVSAGPREPSILAWRTATWEVVRSRSFAMRNNFFVAVSPDGKTLAVGTVASQGESALALLDAATLQQREGVVMVEQVIGPFAFSPDSKTLAATCNSIEGPQIILCETDSGRELRRIELRVAANALAFAPDGKTVAAGNRDGTILLFDPAHGLLRGTFTGHPAFITRLAYAPDGRTLASADIEGTIKLWWVGK
jgi:WD40 repeat protein